MASLFDDWSSMASGIASGGGWSSGPLGAQGASAGIAGGVGIGGLALMGLGMADTMSAEKSITSDTQAIAGLDEQLNNLKRQQMHLTTNRQEMENFRNVQRAGATTKAAAIASGGGLGSSGYGGARSAEVTAGARNTSALVQNQMIGDKSFDVTNQIDQYQAKLAADRQKLSTGQGLSSLGSGLLSGAMNIGMLLA